MKAFAPAAALIALALCAPLTPAHADGDPTTDTVPRLLPYQGLLELDGRPVDATGDRALHLMFALYDAADAEQPVYRQPLVVEVYAGRFTATIGPTGLGADDAPIGIDAVIRAADDLHLGMTLLGDPDDPADDIPLQNRQRIHASPYAMWTTSATDISVARHAIIGGDATIGGTLRVEGDAILPAGSIGTGEIADGTVRLRDLDARLIGDGLFTAGEGMGVDRDWLQSEIRSWVRSHCKVQLGWRDSCGNCGSAPLKIATGDADGTCGGGQNSACRQGAWAGFNTDGDVNDDDVFYIRLNCE